MPSDDPYAMEFDTVRFKARAYFGMGFGLTDPIAAISLDAEKLPEPLRRSARQMQDRELMRYERRAAGNEYLLLAEEWKT